MINILVTGADGQLGQCLRAAAENSDDMVFDFRAHQELDITNKTTIDNLLDGSAYDYCINCAAYTNVEAAEKNPEKAFEINAEGVGKLAGSCKEEKVILIHISTDYVFDGEKKGPYYPSDVANPINEYGKSKLKGEEYIRALMSDYFIIRTSWLYSEYGDNFHTKILSMAETSQTLTVTDSQVGCPTDANMLARFVISLISTKSREFGIHHYTDGTAMTWYQFAKKILIEHGYQEKLKHLKKGSYQTLAARPSNSVLAQ